MLRIGNREKPYSSQDASSQGLEVHSGEIAYLSYACSYFCEGWSSLVIDGERILLQISFQSSLVQLFFKQFLKQFKHTFHLI